nr:hypothetical protein [Bacteroidota bacterium]
MKKTFYFNMLIVALIAGSLLFSSCKKNNSDDNKPKDYVTITDRTMYWEVNIDFTSGDRQSIGREYGEKVLSIIPDFEEGGDAYLAMSVYFLNQAHPEITYEVLIQRALEIYNNIQAKYKDEMEGFASVLSGGTVNVMGDGKLSRDEYIMLNFTPDVCTATGCSGVAVFGSRSETGQTIVGRNTDWAIGPPAKSVNGNNNVTNTNAVIYLHSGEDHVAMFATLGSIGTSVGINSKGIFVANLYSEIGTTYSAVGKKSVMLDVRDALESFSTIDEVGAFLGDPTRIYAYHNNMFIADKNTAKVLENDYERNRELRVVDSELNPGITWSIPNAISCVNAFVLKGNFDNFTGQVWNTNRWASFKNMLEQGGNAVDIERVRTIMSYHKPESGGMDPGDIYNAGTVQSIAYSFSDNHMELWLGTYVDDPQYVTISIPFLNSK